MKFESNVYKKFLNNTFIFGISEIFSKGITLLLVQLYTFHLTQSEYGQIDIIQVTINLLVPIVSLSIFESVLRYVMDKEDITSVFTNCFLITCISSLFTISIFSILNFFYNFNGLLPYVCLIIVLQLFQSLFSQFLRGIGMVNVFAINAILMGITIGITNLIFIVWLDFGIKGYLLSVIIGLIVSIIYININVNTFKYIKFYTINLNMKKKLLNYSIPLMPNSIMWWVINASSRYFILFFAGTAHNGLFAVASKVPSVLSIFNSIFFKAWQLSAIEEFESKNNTTFYGKIFNHYQQFLFIIVSIVFVFLKFIFDLAIGHEFYNAWKYTPFLIISVLFSSFSSFFGTTYIASKETNGVFRTSVIGGIANVILNIFTIPLLGVIGASLSSMISFFIITLIRWYDTKKYIKIEYNYRNISINFFLITLHIIIMYLNFERIIEFIIHLIIFLLILKNNSEIIKSTALLIRKRKFPNT